MPIDAAAERSWKEASSYDVDNYGRLTCGLLVLPMKTPGGLRSQARFDERGLSQCRSRGRNRNAPQYSPILDRSKIKQTRRSRGNEELIFFRRKRWDKV